MLLPFSVLGLGWIAEKFFKSLVIQFWLLLFVVGIVFGLKYDSTFIFYSLLREPWGGKVTRKLNFVFFFNFLWALKLEKLRMARLVCLVLFYFFYMGLCWTRLFMMLYRFLLSKMCMWCGYWCLGKCLV